MAANSWTNITYPTTSGTVWNATGGTSISGQILWSGNITVTNPQAYGTVYGWTVGVGAGEEPDPFDTYAAEVLRIAELEESLQGS